MSQKSPERGSSRDRGDDFSAEEGVEGLDNILPFSTAPSDIEDRVKEQERKETKMAFVMNLDKGDFATLNEIMTAKTPEEEDAILAKLGIRQGYKSAKKPGDKGEDEPHPENFIG